MNKKKQKRMIYVLAIEFVLACCLLLGIMGLRKGGREGTAFFAQQQEHQLQDKIQLSQENASSLKEKANNQPQTTDQKEQAEKLQALEDIKPQTTDQKELAGELQAPEDIKPQTTDQKEQAEHITQTAEDASDTIPVFSSAQSGTLLESTGAVPVIFYLQTDKRWADLRYGGEDTIEKYACGPTSMSIVISSLTDTKVDPVQMSEWAFQNNYWYPKSGSLHSLIPDAAKVFGLHCIGVENTPAAGEVLTKALKEGKLVVALMGKGQFTKSGHFIVLRGITADGMVLVADPASEERTEQSWELETIIKEAKSWAAANGPFWIIDSEKE